MVRPCTTCILKWVRNRPRDERYNGTYVVGEDVLRAKPREIRLHSVKRWIQRSKKRESVCGIEGRYPGCDSESFEFAEPIELGEERVGAGQSDDLIDFVDREAAVRVCVDDGRRLDLIVDLKPV